MKLLIKSLDALCYLDDIAHGRKMKLDAHELKLIIEKELKALQIIKEKLVDVNWLNGCDELADYNLVHQSTLEQKEYDLLKEVL